MFLDLVRYEEFEIIFGFVFDRFFENFTGKGLKLGRLTTVIRILQVIGDISDRRALQLLECIDFDDERSTNSVIFMFVEKLPWNLQREVIKRVNQANARRGIAGFDMEKVIKLVPSLIINSKSELISFGIVLYSYETEAAFEEIFVNEHGHLELPDDNVSFFTSIYDGKLVVYFTKSGFFIIERASGEKYFISIIPYFKMFKSVDLAYLFWKKGKDIDYG